MHVSHASAWHVLIVVHESPRARPTRWARMRGGQWYEEEAHCSLLFFSLSGSGAVTDRTACAIQKGWAHCQWSCRAHGGGWWVLPLRQFWVHEAFQRLGGWVFETPPQPPKLDTDPFALLVFLYLAVDLCVAVPYI